MSKENRPAFMLYASDWLTGTAEMTLEEKGIFIDMLCHQWLRGELPSDEKKLIRMLGGDANRNAIASVSHKFRMCESGGLQNAKLEEVRETSRESQNRRSVANKANADKRWAKSRESESEPSLFENEIPIKVDANRNAKSMRNESECISEYESENKEKKGVRNFTQPLENFISAYGGIKGTRRETEAAYIEAVNMLNGSEGLSDLAAHELIATQAARDRQFCSDTGQTRNNTHNWLQKRYWEKDYDQELIIWQESQKHKKNDGKSNNKDAARAYTDAAAAHVRFVESQNED